MFKKTIRENIRDSIFNYIVTGGFWFSMHGSGMGKGRIYLKKWKSTIIHMEEIGGLATAKDERIENLKTALVLLIKYWRPPTVPHIGSCGSRDSLGTSLYWACSISSLEQTKVNMNVYLFFIIPGFWHLKYQYPEKE